jgi:hypothetical protein
MLNLRGNDLNKPLLLLILGIVLSAIAIAVSASNGDALPSSFQPDNSCCCTSSIFITCFAGIVGLLYLKKRGNNNV